MVKKFLRTLFILVAYFGIVTSGQCSEAPGFYSEFGDPECVMKLRSMPADERSVRLELWAQTLGRQLRENNSAIYEDIREYEARLWKRLDMLPGRDWVKGGFAACLAEYSRLMKMYIIEPPYSLDMINRKLRAIAERKTCAEVKREMMVGRDGKHWIIDLSGGKSASTTSLDDLMRWTLMQTLESCRVSSLSF